MSCYDAANTLTYGGITLTREKLQQQAGLELSGTFSVNLNLTLESEKPGNSRRDHTAEMDFSFFDFLSPPLVNVFIYA